MRMAEAGSDASQETDSENSDGDKQDVFEIESDAFNDSNKGRMQFYRRYKIQEVVKKDQIILVQVSKDERGNKGASLTTYVTIAGRYCVLMPNATREGGVSKKVADYDDRKKLKKIVSEITQEGAGSLIIRTAGANKTKSDIKRDYTYLLKLWESIRDKTLSSEAPEFIYEEADIIKKSLRDLSDSSVTNILIEGQKHYDEAKEYSKLMAGRNSSKIKLYKGVTPIFTEYGIEAEISKLNAPEIELKSGGSIVINHTEALTAIDVNSGRSTRDRNVESTAVRTNLEAAQEISRQLKLRDISGLIVIDFIDMVENKNKKNVERKIKDNLAFDRARIQVGNISPFGLLEMSRQRLRQNLTEYTTSHCSYCDGKGRVRNLESTAASAIRAIEREITQKSVKSMDFSAGNKLILYFLNHKKETISSLESEYNVRINMSIDEDAGGDGFFIEVHKNSSKPKNSPNSALSVFDSGVQVEEGQCDESGNVESDIEHKSMNKKRAWKKSSPRNKSKASHNKTSSHSDDEKLAQGSEISNDGKLDDTIISSKRPKRNRKSRNSTNPNTEESGVISDAEENAVDATPQAPKATQSKLKEIWKKIVE